MTLSFKVQPGPGLIFNTTGGFSLTIGSSQVLLDTETANKIADYIKSYDQTTSDT